MPDLTLSLLRLLANNTSTPIRLARLDMQFTITPEWVARLRQDVKDWDEWAEQGREYDRRSGTELWAWPDMTAPLKSTGLVAGLVSMK